MSLTTILQSYAKKIRDLRRANPDVPETALAPAFQRLLEELLPLLPSTPNLIIVPEFAQAGVGRPDIALKRTGSPARAFVELKAPTKSANPARWRGHDQSQFHRFKELTSWAISNFIEFRLFHRDDETGHAVIVPEACLRPDKDENSANRAIAAHDSQPFLNLLQSLCSQAGVEPCARSAEDLAKLMAHSARLVRGIVVDRLAELREANIEHHALLDVRQVFRDVLYSHPEAAGYSATDFDTLFSAAFAQTLAFGLLLVRESTGNPVENESWRDMPEEHPLMRTALRVLSQEEVVQDIGIGFEVMRDTINSFSPEILEIKPDGKDPILYFYEDFLHVFDPAEREKYGVFYTPIEIVRYMVSALDQALINRLNTEGLRDPNVTILDPATGTGTYLLGIAERVAAQVKSEGSGMAALTLRDLARRMYGFELLVGPYAVAHYRLHHALSRNDADDQALASLPRLGVYLTDTLAEPNAASVMGSLGFVAEGIANERREANRIKSEQPILAIIGNPPYRRLEEGENRTLVGDWLDTVWDDLKSPVKQAGQGGQLNTFPELSVAFWRWAIWKLFEANNAPRRGVVAFISNRKFLTGWPYAGLRKMMRERFDRIDIIDLRGDVRRGARAGVDDDQGVFNIMVGTAITICVADGSKAENALAEINYYDSWANAHFSRRSKLDWLTEHLGQGCLPDPVAVERNLLDDFRPKPFLNSEWLSLKECFSFAKSGMKSGDDNTFININRGKIRENVTNCKSIPTNYEYVQALETPLSYRPLDNRWLYNDLRLLDRPGPELQRVWGTQNYSLYAMPSGTGAGPAVWSHGLLPDYHAFRGSYGGYAFPLFDRRFGTQTSNINPYLMTALSAAYGETIGGEAVYDCILGLLSATSYSLRFAEDLEDVFPHVPFPSDVNLFMQIAELGRQIRMIEAFEQPPSNATLQTLANLDTEPVGPLCQINYTDGGFCLCADGSGRITNISEEIWTFSVSGYPLLPRWLSARTGVIVDLVFVRQLRDICGRIAELIALFHQADALLVSALENCLSREALGFAEIKADGA